MTCSEHQINIDVIPRDMHHSPMMENLASLSTTLEWLRQLPPSTPGKDYQIQSLLGVINKLAEWDHEEDWSDESEEDDDSDESEDEDESEEDVPDSDESDEDDESEEDDDSDESEEDDDSDESEEDDDSDESEEDVPESMEMGPAELIKVMSKRCQHGVCTDIVVCIECAKKA
jgi:hypothetical protein